MRHACLVDLVDLHDGARFESQHAVPVEELVRLAGCHDFVRQGIVATDFFVDPDCVAARDDQPLALQGELKAEEDVALVRIRGVQYAAKRPRGAIDISGVNVHHTNVRILSLRVT